MHFLCKNFDVNKQNVQQRTNRAETFSNDLAHEIRNPLASLKSASELLDKTTEKNEGEKLLKIINHDVERIERLISIAATVFFSTKYPCLKSFKARDTISLLCLLLVILQIPNKLHKLALLFISLVLEVISNTTSEYFFCLNNSCNSISRF